MKLEKFAPVMKQSPASSNPYSQFDVKFRRIESFINVIKNIFFTEINVL